MFRRVLAAIAITGCAVAAVALATSQTAGAASGSTTTSCPDVEVIFARGTYDIAPLGIVGKPLVSDLAAALPGKTVSGYGVVYPANLNAATGAGVGATDMTNQLVSTASKCADTKFVLGGYSQGATVTDLAIGLKMSAYTPGLVIPDNYTNRVTAIVVFGNPLAFFNSSQTIETLSPTYGQRTKSYCASGDPVCGAGQNVMAHVSYNTNGDVTDAARFATDRILNAPTS